MNAYCRPVSAVRLGLDVVARTAGSLRYLPDAQLAHLFRFVRRLCAHARSGDAAMIAGDMGSGQTFDDAITEFATD